MKKIANKIVLLVILNLFVLATVLVTVGLVEIKEIRENSIQTLEETLRDDFDLKIKEQVENVISLLEVIHQDHLSGKISLAEAKRKSANYVRELRYADDGYFWIDTKEGVNVVLLGKEAEGKSRIDLQDKHGNDIIKNFITQANNGGGFTNYWFPRPNETAPSPKRSYTQLFAPYGWVVGTGNYIDDIDTLVDAQNIRIVKLVAAIKRKFVIVTILLVLIAIFVTTIFSKRLVNPIIHLSNLMTQVADGQLDLNVDTSSNDEVGQLGVAVKKMLDKLREIVSNVTTNSTSIASASNQISGTSQQLSQSANQQAASVEEVSSSMEEMLANIQQNTESALTTEKIAQNSVSDIQTGSDATENSVKAMNDIAEKIHIINSIANKTDLLAINASIEAARAGEHGKGFAVVAAEVRKLAENSSKAAKEIDELSVNGVEVSDKAGKKLLEVVPEIEKTAQLIQEIAAASQEQNHGAGQINTAIQQLNSITQQNAAASEQLASSSLQMREQAQSLLKLVSFFKLGSNQQMLKDKF